MMNNLFSMFDPSSQFMSTGWLMMGAFLMIIPVKSMKLKEKNSSMNKMILNKVGKEIFQLMGNTSKKMSPNKLVKIFSIVMIVNILALIPFNFTPTAHISISLSLSMTLWLTSILSGWLNNTKNCMVHMTPMGTPTPLMNFMVVIEMVSNLIRPITLSVRLSANMVAGHLLISLLSNFSLASNMNSFMSTPMMGILSTLEMVVALIQAYVIVTLITLYQNESM